MESNVNFDNQNDGATASTLEVNQGGNYLEAAGPFVAPRVVNLSQMQIAAMTAMGKSNEEIGAYYGVTSKEIYRAKVNFGMYKVRETNEPKVDYVINLNFDMNM